MKARNVVLAGVIASVLTGLSLHPTTGWICRVQLQTAVCVTPALLKNLEGAGPSQKTAAAQHPKDFNLQFAGALLKGSSEQYRTALRALVPQFPNEPALRAAILRFDTAGAVKTLHRDDENFGAPSRTTANTKPAPEKPLDPAVLAAFDAEAEAGERLAPDNAYFPLMRAIGLYGAGRDAEAHAALHRAAQKPLYNDYVREEAEARWALSREAYGNPGTIAEVAQSAAILFPHYAYLRSTARIALAQAIRAEQAGDVEAGMQLRKDLRTVGGLMRRDATSIIGGLVGSAIANISAGRPGGQEVPGWKESKGDARNALALSAYKAYCEKIGHSDEARAFQQEREKGDQARKLNAKASARGIGIFEMDRLAYLGALWLLGCVVLSAVFTSVLLGGLLKGLSTTGRIREGKPAHPGVTAGLWFFLGNGVLSLLAVATMKIFPIVSGFCWVGSTVAAVYALWVLIRHAEAGQRRVAWGVACATVVASAGFLALALLPVLGGGRMWYGLLTGLGASSEGESTASPVPVLRVLGLGLGLWLLPALVTAGLMLQSRLRRVPVTVGVVRGFPRFALPLATVLVFLFAGIVWNTAQQEAHYQSELRQMIQHEGRYNAHLMGETWPE